jgi:hypothetical protein
VVSEFWRANCSRAHRSVFMTSPQQEGGAQHSVQVGSWHIASVQAVVMSAVPWHRTCRLREGADRVCAIAQSEHVRFGKCVHREE